MKENLIVPPEWEGMELDEFLSLRFPRVGKGHLRRLIREGKVSIDGVAEVNPKPLKREAYVVVELPTEGLPEVAKSAIEVPVLYEDDDLLFVDKPPGLSVEPERWERQGATLIGSLASWREEQSGGALVDYRPRVVHRLDKDTSGVLCLAKNLEAERHLRSLFENRKIEKKYFAIVEGEVPASGGLVDLPIGPDSKKSGRMKIDERNGKPAQTAYEVAEAFHGFTLLAVFPRTGRTHQIRVHLSVRGFPLAVDAAYGNRDKFYLSQIKRGYRLRKGREEKPILNRLSLHAASLALNSPKGNPLTVESNLAPDLGVLLEKLRKFRGF